GFDIFSDRFVAVLIFVLLLQLPINPAHEVTEVLGQVFCDLTNSLLIIIFAWLYLRGNSMGMTVVVGDPYDLGRDSGEGLETARNSMKPLVFRGVFFYFFLGFWIMMKTSSEGRTVALAAEAGEL